MEAAGEKFDERSAGAVGLVRRPGRFRPFALVGRHPLDRYGGAWNRILTSVKGVDLEGAMFGAAGAAMAADGVTVMGAVSSIQKKGWQSDECIPTVAFQVNGQSITTGPDSFATCTWQEGDSIPVAYDVASGGLDAHLGSETDGAGGMVSSAMFGARSRCSPCSLQSTPERHGVMTEGLSGRGFGAENLTAIA